MLLLLPIPLLLMLLLLPIPLLLMIDTDVAEPRTGWRAQYNSTYYALCENIRSMKICNLY
jgi:hypothetical protein